MSDERSMEMEELWQKASEIFDTDNKAGLEAWLDLAERGYARAMHSVAWCFREGLGTEKDIEAAIGYYRRAIEGGYRRSYMGLYGLYNENGRNDEALDVVFEGAKNNDGDCYELLASLCDRGLILNGNTRLTACFATRAFQNKEDCGTMLGLLFLNGTYYPVVYPYAKYCFEKSSFSRAELEESGVSLPDFWDELEPIEPKLPTFDIELDSCEDEINPDELLNEAKPLIFADEPDIETATPIILRAARAGLAEAMYYVYLLDIEGWQEFLVQGADEYGHLGCIEALASLFSENATYQIGNPFLNEALRYWGMRRKLHEHIPMGEELENCYNEHKRKMKGIFNKTVRTPDPDAPNAVLLRADGSFERIKVDFSTLEGLYAPIGCDRLNIISTARLREISNGLGFTVVMYCDERGMMKNLPENEIAAALSGYDVIFGDVVICGFDKDYAPLYSDEIDDVCELLDRQ